MILALLLPFADAAELVVTDGPLETSEAGGEAMVAVSLSEDPGGFVVVTVDLGGSDEVATNPSVLFFGPESWDVSQTLVVRGLDDATVDGDQPFVLVLDGTAGVSSVGTATLSGTNLDDDRFGLEVSPHSGVFLSEDGLEGEITVALTAAPTAAVDVVVAPLLAGEVEVLSPNLSFDATNWATPQVVGLRGFDDLVADGDRAWVVEVSTSTTDPDWAAVAPVSVDGLTLDNDQAGLIVSPGTPLVVNEDGSIATVTVRLRSQPMGKVVVVSESSDLTEVSAFPSTLEFGESNWDQPQSLVLTGLDDDWDDGSQSVRVLLEPMSDEDPTYEALLGEEVAVTNTDDGLDLLTPGQSLDAISVKRWAQGGLGCDHQGQPAALGWAAILLLGWTGGRRRKV